MQRRGTMAGARLRSPKPPGNLEEPLLLPWHPTTRGRADDVRVPQKAGRSELPSLPAFGPAAHARIQPRSWLAGAKSRASHTHDKCSLVSFLTHRRVWREKTSKHGHRLPWHSGRAILSSPHFPPLQASCCNYHDACPPAGALENWLPRQSLISPRLPSWHGSSLRRESRLRALPTSSSRVATGGGTARGARLGATRHPKDISEARCASSGEDGWDRGCLERGLLRSEKIRLRGAALRSCLWVSAPWEVTGLKEQRGV